MRALAVVLALVSTAGCHKSSPASEDLASAGDAASSGDLASAPDLARSTSTAGIACGTMPCAANAQFCCTSDSGQSGTCGFGNDAANCGGNLFYCDGPEDCPPAMPHCCVYNGTSVCSDNPCAGTQAGGYEMCHRDADCGSGLSCCSKSTTPYELCLSACP